MARNGEEWVSAEHSLIAVKMASDTDTETTQLDVHSSRYKDTQTTPLHLRC